MLKMKMKMSYEMLMLRRFSREVPEKTSPAWRFNFEDEGETSMVCTGTVLLVSISSSMVMTLGWTWLPGANLGVDPMLSSDKM